MPPIDDLLDEIFDRKNPPLRAEFEGWIRESRRFKAFATTYRSKIRAKLRNANGESGIQDIRAELAAALLLLREERFTLDYERYAALKQRGPDFTVTYKTHTPLNIEVRRMRSVDLEDTDAPSSKLMGILCDKVGQMPPSIVNLLWLVAERTISEADLIRATTTLRQLAERKTEEYFTRRGFASAADFLKHYRQLSGIVVHPSGMIWLNTLARHPVPPDIVTVIQRLNSP